jgi:hypothetical protein
MDWNQVYTIVGANIALVLVCLSTTITLFLWARHEAGEDRKQFLSLMLEMKNEMKDFHGRLERIDAEFKSHLLNAHKG